VNKSMMLAFILGLVLLLSACGSTDESKSTTVSESPVVNEGEAATANEPTQASGRMGMGPGSGMMVRHHATIPEEYAGVANPIAADEASLERGGEIYTTNCAVCHGDGGMGDGPGAAGLDPAPVAIAHTSQMMGDDYLFWRISEGGAIDPFNSTMIAWKGVLDEGARWDVISYVQALGSGAVRPGQRMGGAAFDPEVEAANQAQMLAKGVEQGVITEAEAAVFAEAHIKVDGQMAQMREAGASGGMDEMMPNILATFVASGDLSQEQADTFMSVHDRLGEAGLMQ